MKKKNLALTFGQVLKEYRIEKGLSQQALADYSEMDRGYISRIERGLSAPSILTIFKLAEILQVKPHKLVELVYNKHQAD